MFNIVSCIKFIIYNVLKNDLEKFHFVSNSFFKRAFSFPSLITLQCARKEINKIGYIFRY